VLAKKASLVSWHANAASINNPNFESGWQGWQIVDSPSDDTAISEVAKSGQKSAKITGSGGRFEQCVTVAPETDYELKAFVRGKGRVGAVIGKKSLSVESPGDGGDWMPVLLSFNSESEREILVFGAFVDGDVRFDDFTLAVTDRPMAGSGSERQQTGHAEGDASGCGPSQPVLASTDRRPTRDGGFSRYGLRTDVPPSENFDLTDWKLTLPVDQDGDGKADETSEASLADGWSDPAVFYTDPVTGGLVFRAPQGVSATTKKSKYPRTELREMLRAGDRSIDTRGKGGAPNKNNWVLPSAPETAKAKAGGVGGLLQATLAVNQVTRVGKAYQVGRVIIGQIHAKDDEVLRLYHRKLPTNSLGSLYYAHEIPNKGEVYVDIIGDRGDFISNPENGSR